MTPRGPRRDGPVSRFEADRVGHRSGHDRGAVTAELALALPALMLVVAVLLLTAGATSAQLRCADAARAGARVAALGQSDGEVAAVARQVAGRDVVVQVVRSPPWVEVTVTADLPGAWFTAGPLGLVGTSTAWVEP